MDSIELYPIRDACLVDIVSYPHKLLLLGTLYIKNKKKEVVYDGGTEIIPLCTFVDTHTAEFVRDLVDSRVSKYEVRVAESAYLYQVIFDNYEWRTLVYYALITDIPDAESMIKVDETKRRVFVEKRAPIRRRYF